MKQDGDPIGTIRAHDAFVAVRSVGDYGEPHWFVVAAQDGPFIPTDQIEARVHEWPILREGFGQ